jgi:hypothetical protein
VSYTYFMNDSQVTLINLSNGNRVVMYRDNPKFETFKDLITTGDYVKAEELDTKAILSKFGMASVSGNFGVVIKDGIGKIQLSGSEYPLADAIVKRILRMVEDGFSAQPLVNFLENLYKNPSKTAVDELFLFLDSCELPITDDGHFIAYKIVQDDYMDIYSKSFSNKVGKVVSMARFEVDDNRNNTCSKGLHFCSKEYLPSYGSSKKGTDRCMLVKINPADVVSIPSDYNNAKGRTWKYEVVGEVTDTEWRDILLNRDYTNASVVGSKGQMTLDEAFNKWFYEDAGDIWWLDSNRLANFNHVVSRLVRETGLDDETVEDYIQEVFDNNQYY